MEYSSLANVWANRFHIFDKTILTLQDLECTLSYIDTCSYELYNKHPNELFNLVTYDTYYGNFGHGISFKIERMIENGYIIECHPYLYILLLVRYNYNLDLTKIDYYEETALEYIQTNNAVKNIQLKILEKILNPSYCIISKAQSFVRRWLAKRNLQKMKLKRVLNNILIAPNQQIEYRLFKHFPGGQEFLNMKGHFENEIIGELMNDLINVET